MNIASSWAIIVTAVAASAGLILAIWHIYTIKKESRIARAHEFIKKSNTLKFINHEETANIFLTESQTEDEKDKKWNSLSQQDNKNKRVSITIILNFYEHMGLMYNNNLVDKETIKTHFKNASERWYKISEWYLKKLSEKYGKDQSAEEWQKMNKSLGR